MPLVPGCLQTGLLSQGPGHLHVRALLDPEESLSPWVLVLPWLFIPAHCAAWPEIEFLSFVDEVGGSKACFIFSAGLTLAAVPSPNLESESRAIPRGGNVFLQHFTTHAWSFGGNLEITSSKRGWPGSTCCCTFACPSEPVTEPQFWAFLLLCPGSSLQC